MWNGKVASMRKVGWGLVVDAILLLKVRLPASQSRFLLPESWEEPACKGIRPGLLPEDLLTVNRRGVGRS